MKKTILASILIFAPFYSIQLYGQSIQQEIQRRGFTLEALQKMAINAGIDLNNPTQLANYARKFGISENQINDYISQFKTFKSLGLQANDDQYFDAELINMESDFYDQAIDSPALNEEEIDSSDVSETTLPFFGYDIFSTPPPRLQHRSIGTVDKGYVISPDDVLKLTVWGDTEFQYQLKVDKEGRIFIPSIGLTTVAGQSLDNLRESLKNTLSRSYSGLTKYPPTVFMDLTVTRFSPIEVFVYGEVNYPGGYIFSSNSNLFNVLYKIGGPKTSGSLRDIRIIRDSEVIASIDLYEMLVKGVDKNTIPLLNNDKIFIPPRKSTVSIVGPIFREAKYELLEGESIANLIEFTGGILPDAYGERFHINRIIPIEERTDPSNARKRLDYSLKDVLTNTVKINLKDADSVEIFKISDVSDQYVKIEGGVNQPGIYQLNEGIFTVADLIKKADGLQDDALTSMATIIRIRDDSTKYTLKFDVAKALENDPLHNLNLERRDYVKIYETDVREIKDKWVIISGEVKQPDTLEFFDGMTLDMLILEAGGFTQASDINAIEVSRINERKSFNNKVEIFEVPLLLEEKNSAEMGVFYDGSNFNSLLKQASKFELQTYDHIYVRKNPKFELQNTITLLGEVMYPGNYSIIEENELLSKAIARAGGLTTEAYPRGAKLVRDSLDVIIELDKILSNDVQSDIKLKSGDSLFIPKQPNTVLVTGNVALDGYIKYRKGKRLTYYLDQAGGLQPNTFKYLLLTQANGATYRVKRKGIFKENPVVEDGAEIRAIYEPKKTEKERINFRKILDETLAVLTSTLTVYLLIDRINQ